MTIEKDKFTRKYLHLIYEMNGSRPRMSMEQIKEAYKTIVKFREKDGKIIEEDQSSLIDVPEEAIQFFLDNFHQKIDGSWLKVCFKTSRHWRNLKNVDFKNVYFDLFDFSDTKSIDRFSTSCFGTTAEKIEEAREDFRTCVGDIEGFYLHVEPLNLHVVCINSKANDIRQVIYHELSHLVQELGGIRIVDGMTEEDVKNGDMLKKEFGFCYKQVVDFFSGKEFIPHIDDLVKDLKKLRRIYFSGIDGLEFKHLIFDFLSSKTLREVESSEIFKRYKEMNNGGTDGILMLLFSKISGYRFQKILSRMESAFKPSLEE